MDAFVKTSITITFVEVHIVDIQVGVYVAARRFIVDGLTDFVLSTSETPVARYRITLNRFIGDFVVDNVCGLMDNKAATWQASH
ncbi:hypothetical protein KIN20_001457 [Parelaphostrongylus tenuis]|uniref:Uncharacterized protein n=1 Tax=Parelaphostrongylus tenuis TaxID=148309 RepID=A0AAD5QC88_PARTN|nr:hypothetical protein KIN20_001457 [Parelaphostrongylus tenuis]